MAQSGAMDMVALLEPFPEDVTARDRDGNSSLHVAASAANYEMVKVRRETGYLLNHSSWRSSRSVDYVYFPLFCPLSACSPADGLTVLQS